MRIDEIDMVLVHRVFRNELHRADGLVSGVAAGDTTRAKVVGDHLEFIVAALHHHHAAEDELIWPKLHSRAPTRVADVTRMENQHRVIAEDVARVQAIVGSWVNSADDQLTEELVSAIQKLSASVDDHLTDEERSVLPVITDHITAVEWQEATKRGAEFLSAKNLRLGLVLAGYVLDAGSRDERRRFMANVPLGKRLVARLFGKRALDAYQTRFTEHPPSTASCLTKHPNPIDLNRSCAVRA